MLARLSRLPHHQQDRSGPASFGDNSASMVHLPGPWLFCFETRSTTKGYKSIVNA